MVKIKRISAVRSLTLEYGRESGLEFGADKTEVVVFTRKRIKTSHLPFLHMGMRDLVYSDTAKYLGILLGSKLTLVRISGTKQKRLLDSCIVSRPLWVSYGDLAHF